MYTTIVYIYRWRNLRFWGSAPRIRERERSCPLACLLSSALAMLAMLPTAQRTGERHRGHERHRGQANHIGLDLRVLDRARIYNTLPRGANTTKKNSAQLYHVSICAVCRTPLQWLPWRGGSRMLDFVDRHRKRWTLSSQREPKRTQRTQSEPRAHKASQGHPKGSPMATQWEPMPLPPQREPKGAQGHPKGSQGAPKGTQREPNKGSQRHTKDTQGIQRQRFQSFCCFAFFCFFLYFCVFFIIFLLVF